MILSKKRITKALIRLHGCADQTAWMRRLVCACVVRNPPDTGFLPMRHILPIQSRFELEYILLGQGQVFSIPLHYRHSNLVPIHSQAQEISCSQESVTPTPMGSAPKTIWFYCTKSNNIYAFSENQTSFHFFIIVKINKLNRT